MQVGVEPQFGSKQYLIEIANLLLGIVTLHILIARGGLEDKHIAGSVAHT